MVRASAANKGDLIRDPFLCWFVLLENDRLLILKDSSLNLATISVSVKHSATQDKFAVATLQRGWRGAKPKEEKKKKKKKEGLQQLLRSPKECTCKWMQHGIFHRMDINYPHHP